MSISRCLAPALLLGEYMELTPRLKLIADMVKKGSRVCDVGTDHAHLPIYLSQNGIASNVIATDVAQKPLCVAEKNVKRYNVQNVELRLCDGLSGVAPFECDVVIIAGMGGETIRDIIRNAEWVKSKKLILQPNTSAPELRTYLFSNGYKIERETYVKDRRFIYSVMEVEKGETAMPSLMDIYCGRGEGPLYEEYSAHVLKHLKNVLRGMKCKNTRTVNTDALKETLKEIGYDGF